MAGSPSKGRLVSFRLADVPLTVRRRHGAALVRAASEDARLLDAVQFTRAIEEPSDTVYRVPEAAWQAAIGR